MSVWVLGLGAGLTYVLMKQRSIYGTIQRVEYEHEQRHGQLPADGGVSVGDLERIKDKGSRKPAAETPASTELPTGEQSKLNSAGKALESEEVAYDRAQDGHVGAIEPIYMDFGAVQI